MGFVDSFNTEHVMLDWSKKSVLNNVGLAEFLDCCRLLHDYSEDGVLCVWRAHLRQVEKQDWWQQSSCESRFTPPEKSL